MKKIFSVKAVNSTSESVFFSWQKHQGSYIAINDDCDVRIHDKKGKEIDTFHMPDVCTGFGWHKDGNTLASVCAKNGMLWLWDITDREVKFVETGFRDKDTLTFIMWAKTSDKLAIGTLKGNLFLYDQKTLQKIPILGKHTKRISCGAWSHQNLLALGSEDRSISISNENGDTIKYLSNMDADVNDLQFSCIKNDDNFSKEENTVSYIKSKNILAFFSFETESSSMEVRFNAEYGRIVSYSWYGDGYVCMAFSNGYYVVISTHIKEIGKEILNVKEFQSSLSGFSLNSSIQMIAVVGDSGLKTHHIMQTSQQWSHIPTQQIAASRGGKEDEVFDESSGLRAERVRWSEDGQLLAISTCSAYDSGRCTYAACHVMLAQLPVVGACHGTTVAYLTSLTEVTIQDPILQIRPRSYTVDIEPSFMAIYKQNLVIGLNNIAIFYVITNEGLLKQGEYEYLGSIESIKVNSGFYVSALFDGKVTLHKVNPEDNDHSREMITFPTKEQRNKDERITCYQLTDQIFICATNKGNIYYFHLEEWVVVSEHHHNTAFHMMVSDKLATRLLMVDAKGQVFLFEPSEEKKLEITDCPPKIEGLIWDSWPNDRDVFMLHDKEVAKVYLHVKKHLQGTRVEMVGESKLAYNQTPLMLYAGQLTTMLSTGGIKSFQLDTHPFFPRDGELDREKTKENFLKLLKLGKFAQANYICKSLDEADKWEKLGVAAIETLDVETAIKAYRGKGDVSMVMSLQDLQLIEDKRLLAGHLNVVQGNFDIAQQLFLKSSRPVAALEMRRDLMHWEQVLSLAQEYAPQDIPFISKEYAQQLEFIAQYPASLQHYKQAIIPLKNDRSKKKSRREDKRGGEADVEEHNQACVAGVARMTIRTGDIRKGMELAMRELSKADCKDCALILENMKQYPEAATLYEKAGYYDGAASCFIKAKNWTKVGDIIEKTSVSKIHTQYAKAQEDQKRYNEAAKAYESGKSWEDAIRIHLDHFKNPTEAARIVKESNSIEGAKMIAKFFESAGDFQSAIQFLVFSKCNNEAFRLAQKHGHMQQYADIIGDEASEDDLKSMSVHFENEGNSYMAGKFCHMAGDYREAMRLLLRDENKENHAAISLAVQVAGQANNNQLTEQLISYLMGEVDDYPKDPKYLFQLHLIQNKHKEAASIAIIIAREQQNEGSYKMAHKLLFEMCVELKQHNIKIPLEIINSLTLLHSYVLAKLQIKLGEHLKAARLLIRVSNSISRFPQHAVQILTTTVIECQRSGLKNSAFNFAVMLLKPEYRDNIDPKYKKKIELIVRKPDRTEVEEGLTPCPYCSYEMPSSQLLCSSCKNNIPFCVASGMHIIKDQTTMCPNCQFPSIISEISSLLSGEDLSCPMCGAEMDVMGMKTLCSMKQVLYSYE